jgi:hypothetical protein
MTQIQLAQQQDTSIYYSFLLPVLKESATAPESLLKGRNL